MLCVCVSGRGRGHVCGVQEAAEDAAGPSGSGVARAAAGGRATSLHQHHAVRVHARLFNDVSGVRSLRRGSETMETTAALCFQNITGGRIGSPQQTW